jgi:hypothetical protein
LLDITRDYALECAAIPDVGVTTIGIKFLDDSAMKAMLHRIVAMLTPVAMKFDGVTECNAEYNADVDCDYEHRCAEHEHEPRSKKRQDHRIQRSGGGEVFGEINLHSCRPLLPAVPRLNHMHRNIEAPCHERDRRRG